MTTFAAAVALIVAMTVGTAQGSRRAATADTADKSPIKIVMLTASWCQWCRIFESEVLTDPRVKMALDRDKGFTFEEQDVDRAPHWMDLPGVSGLPTLLFFDASGAHVLSRSGYRSAGEFVLLLEAISAKVGTPDLAAYTPGSAGPRLPPRGLTGPAAAAELRRIESAVFMKVNSHDGGFRSPARVPYPALLLALRRWHDAPAPASPAPARVRQWIDLTLAHALRGRSPRLEGQAHPDFPFTIAQLKRLARDGPEAGPSWRYGLEALPAADAYEGIQDPLDHGVFRYASGPGWYHPHFERRAADNLSWVLLLRAHKSEALTAEATKIWQFIETTFAAGPSLRTSQRANPFYYRLTAEERAGQPRPRVDDLVTLTVQARAARVEPAYCELLAQIPGDRWPAAHWSGGAFDRASRDATTDEVGELLIALVSCGDDFKALADALAAVVEGRWSAEPLPLPGRNHARLYPLAAGLCAVDIHSPLCARALAAVAGIPIDLKYPPPFVALALRTSATATGNVE